MNPLMTTEIVGLYTRERIASARAARARRSRRPAARAAVAELARLWPPRHES
ncbi:MAG: hypothetical protein ABR541_00275 [Candidatus Dormibacteria bacterium]